MNQSMCFWTYILVVATSVPPGSVLLPVVARQAKKNDARVLRGINRRDLNLFKNEGKDSKSKKKCKKKGKGKGKGKGDDMETLEFNQDLTPNVITGTSTTNGNFTTDRRNCIEIGLRVKQRFPEENIFFSNGDGTYSVPANNSCPDTFTHLTEPFCVGTPTWNFEWSVYTDYNCSSGTVANISDYCYELGLDSDPSSDTCFVPWDPITPNTYVQEPVHDHFFGDNTTKPNDGTQSDLLTLAGYESLVNSSTVVQNSWSYQMFGSATSFLHFFDPAEVGNYVIYLCAF